MFFENIFGNGFRENWRFKEIAAERRSLIVDVVCGERTERLIEGIIDI